ncbi:hypothetical protein MHEI_03750 [Mycobacterium heidelbergense]|nr:hypothetical protein MHEI_03750 [Mycobacterium heidelbergense]
MARAPKNFAAAGPGPSGRGVHPDRAITATSSRPEAAEATVVFVAIVADVKNCGVDTGADTPRPNRYRAGHLAERHASVTLSAERHASVAQRGWALGGVAAPPNVTPA